MGWRGEDNGPFHIDCFFAFVGFLVVAGYGSAFGYSAAQASRPGQYSVLADWLVAHGLRYGLGGGPSANVITVDGGGRVAVEPTEVRMGRVGALSVPVVRRRL